MDVEELEPTFFGPGFEGRTQPVLAEGLHGLSLGQRVLALKARLDDYLISQTDRLATKEVWTPFPLAIMTCIGIELIGSYKYGDPGDNSNRHFERVVEDIDPSLGELRKTPSG